MRFLFKNHLENALQALKANRGRTLLTVIGITVGIASMTLIMSLATTASSLINRYFPETKDSVALIRSGLKSPGLPLTPSQQIAPLPTLTEKDASEIANIDGVTAAPMSVIRATINHQDSSISPDKSVIIGTTPEIRQLAGLEMFEGQFIDEANNAVISKQLAIDLYGTEHAIGSTLKIQNQTFTIAGVLKPTDQPLHYLGIDFNQAVILPLNLAKKLSQNTVQIQQIAIKTDDHNSLDVSLKRATEIINTNQSDSVFHTLTGSEIANSGDKTLATVTAILAIVAAISLLVGGISIMNIMLVNVAERQREVGIRKAIGATNRHIINQFLIESAIIGLIGGLAGYTIGLAGAFAAGLFLPLTPALHWQSAALAIGIAVAIGIIFGIYPAARAANRNTIEAMRN